MATTENQSTTITLDRLHVPANVRELDSEHVNALAGSIALQGLLVPVLITPRDTDVSNEFELVAGFHRVAAAIQLGLSEIPVIVREGELLDSDRAVENITSCRRRHEVINADRAGMPTSA